MPIRRFEGIIPPVFTPFKPNDEIDDDSFSRLIQFLIDSGVHALWIEGSSGEFSSMSIEERKRLYELSIEEANGRVPVLAGVSHSSTKIAMELAKYAEDSGADAVQVTPPYYLQSSQSSLFDHYKAIKEAVDIPVAVYDNMGATHHTLSPNLIVRLVRELGIHTIKICPYPHQTPLEKAMNLKKLLGDDINNIIASAQYAYWAFSIGVADGVTSAPLNAMPHEFVRMYEAIQRGDDATARGIYYAQVLPLTFCSFFLSKEEMIYTQTGKTILKWRRIISHDIVRKPLSPLKDWQIKFLRSMAEHIGLI